MPLLGQKAMSTKRSSREQSKGYLSLAYLIVIILCANQFLNLGAWTHVEGKFNIRDVGNAMIMLGVVVMLVRRFGDPALRSPMTLMIVLYLFLVVVQVAVAALIYHQPLIQGALSARHQLYYLSFILFLLVLDSPEKIDRFMNMITLLALAIVVLSVINYFGPTIYDYKWAEGHGERAGITRAYIPAMDLLGAATLWEISKFSEKKRVINGGVTGLILFAAHVFRQTRMRTVGLVGVVLLMMVQRKKWAALAAIAAIGGMGTAILEIGFDIPVVTSQFTSAFENVEEGEGSWKGRMIQLEASMNAFMEHPVIGTGAGVLRAGEAGDAIANYRELHLVALKADLGYASWLKSYGIVGMIWLISFYVIWWKKTQKAKSLRDDLSHMTTFCLGLLIWLAGTFITLNHFMSVGGIVVICIGAAIAIRLASLENKESGD